MERFRRDGYNDLITESLLLTADSQVLDFGGYTGDWSARIVQRYGCRIQIFEPIDRFAGQLESRFAGDDRVTVHRFAIGSVDEPREFFLSEDGTGEFSEGVAVLVEFRPARSLHALLPARIDVVSINIEGGEYELIPALAEAGVLERCETIFVQFHRVVDEDWSDTRRQACRDLLSSTHECVWSYDYVWEAWRHRERSDPGTNGVPGEPIS